MVSDWYHSSSDETQKENTDMTIWPKSTKITQNDYQSTLQTSLSEMTTVKKKILTNENNNQISN